MGTDVVEHTCNGRGESRGRAEGLAKDPAPVDTGHEVERKAEARGHHLQEDQVHYQHVERRPQLEEEKRSRMIIWRACPDFE